MGDAVTVSSLIDDAAQQLRNAGVAFGHGTTNALDEAAWLVLWRLGLPLDADFTSPDGVGKTIVSPADAARVATLLEARVTSRKPAAYLTGEAWLQGLPFTVDERVIVPRSLIAELIVQGDIDYWLGEHTRHVLDLCTGNGSLAIIAALTYPDTAVDAADISQDALDVARINVERHALSDRVRLIQGDGLSATTATYDLIICNPPYVNAQSMAELPAEYRAEPAIALDGNAAGSSDGMDFVRTLMRELPAHLNPRGVLVLEIGHERDYFEAAFPSLEVVWLETSAGQDQVLLVTREALTP